MSQQPIEWIHGNGATPTFCRWELHINKHTCSGLLPCVLVFYSNRTDFPRVIRTHFDKYCWTTSAQAVARAALQAWPPLSRGSAGTLRNNHGAPSTSQGLGPRAGAGLDHPYASLTLRAEEKKRGVERPQLPPSPQINPVAFSVQDTDRLTTSQAQGCGGRAGGVWSGPRGVQTSPTTH